MLLEGYFTSIRKPRTFDILCFLILSIPTFQYNIQMQNIIASLIIPKHKCQYIPKGKTATISPDQCSISLNSSTIRCTNWNFSSLPIGRTRITDYGLVCDKKYLGNIIVILWYLTSVGSPIIGWLSDRFGRKKVALSMLCLETICVFSIPLIHNLIGDILATMLMGLSGSGAVICYIWLLEIVSNEFREFAGSFFYLYGCLANMSFPLISFLTRNWRLTQLISLIPNIFYLGILFVPESSRWLHVINRNEKLLNNLRINKYKADSTYEDKYEKEIFDNNIIINFKEIVLSNTIIIISTYGFTVSLLLFSVAVNLKILSQNIYISIFFIAMMEIPGMILSFLSLRYLSRKESVLILGGIGSTTILISICLDSKDSWQSVARIIVGCLAKIVITSNGTNTLTYIIELVPTTHRSMLLSLHQFLEILSLISALYLKQLSGIYFFLPMVICFILYWITAIIAYFKLPETKGLPMPETMMDQKMLVINKEKEYLIYMNNKMEENDFEYRNEEKINIINRK